MPYIISGNVPTDFEEYVLLLQEPLIEACEFYISLSDIERAYAYTIIKVNGYLPCFHTLCKPTSLYKYSPDQRPITMRLIGKPSPGPSPPRPRLFSLLN